MGKLLKRRWIKGKPKPLGASQTKDGINFALYAKPASSVTLLLREKGKETSIQLDPDVNRTGAVWHVCVRDLTCPVEYAYQIDDAETPDKVLFDPYAVLLTTLHEWGNEANKQNKPFGIVPQSPSFDWEGVSSPKRKMEELIIYEMHVRGFTRHPSSGVTHGGTFLGMIDKISHLVDLGVNAVSLLPIFEFKEWEWDKINPKTQEKLYNYWGYSTVNFFSPMNRYGVKDTIKEFKTLVRELHRNGIEVILDIVFNHVGEPMVYRSIDRETYFMLSNGQESNYTGCGHTMNLSHPIMRQFVRDALYYWVTEMHVDGFRFDLASVMNRDVNGKLLQPSALVEELTYDPYLADTKLIAEPWDLGGYQLGCFYPEVQRWSEWNDKYRDGVRRFIKGDPGSKNEFAGRISGSQDLFAARKPSASINFITAHDGFTLHDLVSYNKKHNHSNQEHNRDGVNNNISWNCGVEGPTTQVEVFNLRQRQIKNFFFALLISRGVPMILMGDEYCHTKNGNNNTWCQDNALNWFLWDKRSPIFHFVRKMIKFRKENPVFMHNSYFDEQEIVWRDQHGPEMNWENPEPFIAFELQKFFIAFNATHEAQTVILPEGKSWSLIINTNATHPHDIIEGGMPIEGSSYHLERYASILLKSF